MLRALTAIAAGFLAAAALAHGAAAQDPGEALRFESLPDLPAPIGLGGPIVGVHGGALVVAGGANFPVPLADGGAKVWHDEVAVLLPGADAWLDGGRLARPLAYAACATVPAGIVVAGGSDEREVFSEVRLLTWDGERLEETALPDLPEPGAFGAAEAIRDVVYVLAGKRSKDEADASNALRALDTSAPERGWRELSPLPGPPRIKVVTAMQRGVDGRPRLFAFSGQVLTRDDAGRPRYRMVPDAWVYAPEEDEWAPVAPLPPLTDPRRAGEDEPSPWGIAAGSASAFGEDAVLTFSGSAGRHLHDAAGDLTPAATRPAFTGRVLRYDVANDAWSEAGAMLEGVVTTRAALFDGRIVIPSGEVRPGVRTPRIQALAIPPADDASAPARLRSLDWIVLALYLAGMVGIGVHFARRGGGTEDFFLGGRRIPWWAAGLSIFGTQLSAITFMAIPATAYGSDWRRFAGQLMLLPVLVLVIRAFVPVLRGQSATTAYEFLEVRFSRAVRWCASALFIAFQLGRMGIVLLLPAIALAAVTGVDTHLCIGLMGVLATAYTALGGISAVIWTDVVQVFVLLGGAALCLALAVADSGGLAATLDLARAADKLVIFEWRWSVTDMVGWVVIVGFLFTNLVPYASDQTVVQRYLTTKDERAAARSLWLNLAITVPTGLLFFGLGTALWAFYAGHPAEAALLPAKDDQLVPWFVVTQLPAGVAGIVIAGIFAAAMSSLDSSMNSITTAVVHDFVAPDGGRGGEDHMGLARGLTIALGVLGTGAAILLASVDIKYLFDAFQRIIGLFGGGVSGVFLLAVFARGANAKGALAGLFTGGAATAFVATATDVNFLLYAAIGTCTSVLVGLLVSALTGGRTPGEVVDGRL